MNGAAPGPHRLNRARIVRPTLVRDVRVVKDAATLLGPS